jgi:hypothetical protein
MLVLNRMSDLVAQIAQKQSIIGFPLTTVLLLLGCLVDCRAAGPEQMVGQVDTSGNFTFVFSHSARPAMLQELFMRRSTNGELVCLVAANQNTTGDSSSWRYGDVPGKNYRIEGCDTLVPGVYRLEFRAHKYGEAFAYGVCDVCVGADGRIFVGESMCNKGTCKAVNGKEKAH